MLRRNCQFKNHRNLASSQTNGLWFRHTIMMTTEGYKSTKKKTPALVDFHLGTMRIDPSTEKPHVIADNVGALFLEGKVFLPRLLPQVR
jgi:hypothetical protein